MKQFVLALLLFSATMSATAQKLTKDCWSLGNYQLTAINGPTDGKIEVTVYDNNVRTLVLQPTRTFILNSAGSVSFTALQAIRTSYVYVVARFFSRNPNGTYSVYYFGNTNGTGQDDGSYDATPTASNQCTGGTVLPIKFTSITAKRIGYNTFKVNFEVAEASGVNTYRIKLSTDGKNFVERAIIFPDNTTAGKYEVVIKL